MSQVFTLFDRELVIEDGFQLDIHLRRLIMQFAEEAQHEFETFYQNKLHGMDDLIKKGEDGAFEIINSKAQKCAEVLASLEIYHVSASTIIRRMRGSYFSSEFEQLENWYISVLENDAQKDAYRKARRQNRSRWVGAGIGLNGAAYATTQAGVLNLASGAAHGAVNLVGKSFSMVGTSLSKNGMFKDKNTRKRLAQAVYMDVYDWIYILESIIMQADYEIEIITQDDEQAAANLFENLKSKNLGAIQRAQIVVQLFETNPCEFEYYEYCVEQFPAQQKSLFALAEYCRIDVNRLGEPALKAIFDAMPHDTEEETLILKAKLQARQMELGITSSAIIDQVEKLLHDFDVEARTFRDVLYDTREQRTAAENDFNDLNELCGNLSTASINECGRLRAIIQNGSYNKKIKAHFLSQIDARINAQKLANAQKNYDELFRKAVGQVPQLTFVKRWKVAPLVITIIYLLCLILRILNVINIGGFGKILLLAAILAWIVTGTIQKIIFNKYAPDDLKKAKEKRDKYKGKV